MSYETKEAITFWTLVFVVPFTFVFSVGLAAIILKIIARAVL